MADAAEREDDGPIDDGDRRLLAEVKEALGRIKVDDWLTDEGVILSAEELPSWARVQGATISTRHPATRMRRMVSAAVERARLTAESEAADAEAAEEDLPEGVVLELEALAIRAKKLTAEGNETLRYVTATPEDRATGVVSRG